MKEALPCSQGLQFFTGLKSKLSGYCDMTPGPFLSGISHYIVLRVKYSQNFWLIKTEESD